MPPSPDDPLPPISLTKRGKTTIVERTVGNPRRDLFSYSAKGDVGLTTLAKAMGYSL